MLKSHCFGSIAMDKPSVCFFIKSAGDGIDMFAYGALPHYRSLDFENSY